jgi:hypothetical protein
MNGIRIDSATNNFVLKNGDFLIDDTDQQDQKEIIYSNKGNFLQDPTLGVGITYYENSPLSITELEKVIRIEFEKDGFNVTQISLTQSDDEYDINVIADRPTN